MSNEKMFFHKIIINFLNYTQKNNYPEVYRIRLIFKVYLRLIFLVVKSNFISLLRRYCSTCDNDNTTFSDRLLARTPRHGFMIRIQ